MLLESNFCVLLFMSLLADVNFKLISFFESPTVKYVRNSQ